MTASCSITESRPIATSYEMFSTKLGTRMDIDLLVRISLLLDKNPRQDEVVQYTMLVDQEILSMTMV